MKIMVDKELLRILDSVGKLYEGKDAVVVGQLQKELRGLGGGDSYSGPVGQKNLAYSGSRARTGHASDFRSTLLQAMNYFDSGELKIKEGVVGSGCVVVGDVDMWRKTTGDNDISDSDLGKCMIYFNGAGDGAIPFVYRGSGKVKMGRFLQPGDKDGVFVEVDNPPWDR